MKTLLVHTLLVAATAAQMMAVSAQAPEIGASTATGALTLIASAMLVLRSRRRK